MECVIDRHHQMLETTLHQLCITITISTNIVITITFITATLFITINSKIIIKKQVDFFTPVAIPTDLILVVWSTFRIVVLVVTMKMAIINKS